MRSRQAIGFGRIWSNPPRAADAWTTKLIWMSAAVNSSAANQDSHWPLSRSDGLNYLLISLRQRQDRSLALHVRAIEEAHAEQGDGQAVTLRDDCVDVMHGHVANAYRVELETISEDIAVGRFHHDLLTVVVVEPEAARLAGGKRDERRAGIHGKSNRHTVHFAIGDQGAPFVCSDHRVVGLGGGTRLGRGGGARLPSRRTHCELHASTLDIEGCAIAPHRQQNDAFARLLSDGESLQRTAFDLHHGLVWEQADDVHVQRGCAGRDQQADGYRSNAMANIHRLRGRSNQ